MKVLRLLLVFAFLAAAQESLNNDSIVKMVKAGLGGNLIVNMIQSQPGKYSLTPNDLINLKQQGVPENVLAAMLGKGAGGSVASGTPSATAAPADGDIPQGIDIGVFYK